MALQPLPLADGIRVQRLGFGTWAWGNKLLWGYDTDDDPQLQAAFNAAVRQQNPFDNSRIFFDTGDSYGTGKLEGQAEALLGRFRAESRGPDRAVIGTKLAVYPTRLTAQSFEDACRASLARMGRDQIELVQAHWSAKNFQPWQEEPMWDGLARCYEAGLARAVGTSNFGPRQLRLANAYWAERGVPHTANQVQFSLLSTLPLESGLFEACAELGVTPIGYSPLALGLLSDRYDETRLPKGPRGKSVSQVAINWCMCKGAVVIVGIKNAAQAEENRGALGWELSGAEQLELEAAAAKVPKKATQNIFQTS